RVDDALAHYRRALDIAPDFVQGWINMGIAAHESVRHELAVEALDRATQLDPRNSPAWQALGNARRASGDAERAAAAFQKAAALAPNNGAAWLNLGVTQRLTGKLMDALGSFEKARQAGISGPELVDARASVLVDLGELEAAFKECRALTTAHPQYAHGHRMLANLLWEYGDVLSPGEDATDAFRHAATSQPDNQALQLSYVGFLLEARRTEEALGEIISLRSRADLPVLASMHANALEGLDRPDEARIVYEEVYRKIGQSSPSFLNAYTRHLLKAGLWDLAAARAEEATQTDPNNQEGWAYLGLAWRLLGDAREYWLCDYEGIIGAVDVEPPQGFADSPSFIEALTASLEPLHKARREPVNQSLRGGSQTPGALFGRPDPVIAATETAIRAAVERHIATLPDDPKHPFLSRKLRSVRIVGSWSVKLWTAGKHVNHIHPEGWMSSAFYVSLPPSVLSAKEAADDKSGWIQFGQPPVELGLNLEPRRYIRPQVGHVALFPSYIMHGTVPFADAEPRMTIAFDMKPID
ncbi:MAG: putative 2OG-Fe(II) oxygenase, partial [Parvularculaceae bacterium]